MSARPRRLPAGPWAVLFRQALRLIDEIRAHGIDDPFWTFGGGTVLMLRYRHRRSKDIDIFVRDPQYLGYVSPRLSDVAESIAADYFEGAGFVVDSTGGRNRLRGIDPSHDRAVRDLVTAASIGACRNGSRDRGEEALAPGGSGERARSV
jgi:hypothetical protein